MKLTASIFIKFLALVYLIAFGSLLIQIKGLIGSNGIIPVTKFLEYINSQITLSTVDKFIQFPTVFWLNSSDIALLLVCLLGIALSIFLIYKKYQNHFELSETLSLLLLYVLYLSIVNVGLDFLSFQWDILLLETGFLSLIFALCKNSDFATKVNIWLFRFLIFKLMLMSALVKLSSGDFNWLNLTALSYHYYTQPLPNPISYFVHQLPLAFHQVSCLLMFAVELILPWGIFMGRKPRMISGFSFIVLMLIVIVTGNYGFFNLLTIAISLWLFDDKFFENYIPKSLLKNFYIEKPLSKPQEILAAQINMQLETLSSTKTFTDSIFKILIIVFASSMILIDLFYITTRAPLDRAFRANLYQQIDPMIRPLQKFFINSPYGLFAVMTTQRLEIVIQGANDMPGQFSHSDWLDYEFYFKPGALNQIPAQVAPYQPRLDWQMWFAALSDFRQQQWFLNFCVKILEGDKEVLRLLKTNPYPKSPPRYLRALIYEYKFNDLETYAATGEFWTRELKGTYLPEISLKNPL